MQKLIFAFLMIVSLKAARVLEQNSVKCKLSIANEESKEKKEDGKDASGKFKVSLNCEDTVSKKKLDKAITCASQDKFQVFKLKKSAEVKKEDPKAKKENNGNEKPDTANNKDSKTENTVNESDVSKKQTDLGEGQEIKTKQDVEQEVADLKQTTPDKDNVPQDKQVELAKENQPEKKTNQDGKRRILANEEKESINTYELVVGDKDFTIANYQLTEITQLEGCQMLVKSLLINSALYLFSLVSVLALF